MGRALYRKENIGIGRAKTAEPIKLSAVTWDGKLGLNKDCAWRFAIMGVATRILPKLRWAIPLCFSRRP